jgi:hypothetical protein
MVSLYLSVPNQEIGNKEPQAHISNLPTGDAVFILRVFVLKTGIRFTIIDVTKKYFHFTLSKLSF